MDEENTMEYLDSIQKRRRDNKDDLKGLLNRTIIIKPMFNQQNDVTNTDKVMNKRLPSKTRPKHLPETIDRTTLKKMNENWRMYFNELRETKSSKYKVMLASNTTIGSQYTGNTAWFIDKLARMDFHGAHLTVLSAKNRSQMGLSGIVIMDTPNMICLADFNEENSIAKKIFKVPKAGTIYKFNYDNVEYILNGSAIQRNTAERSVRKFKDLKSLS